MEFKIHEEKMYEIILIWPLMCIYAGMIFFLVRITHEKQSLKW